MLQNATCDAFGLTNRSGLGRQVVSHLTAANLCDTFSRHLCRNAVRARPQALRRIDDGIFD